MHWSTHLALFGAELMAAGLAVGTIRLRQHYVKRLAAMFPDREPWSLTGDDLVAFMAAGEWSPETRKSARASLVAFYGFGVRSGQVERDRDPSKRLATVRVPAGVPRPAPSSVLSRALLTVSTDRERLMLLLAAYAGLRRAEVARVHPRDFTDAGLRVRGKGGRVRLVPVHPDLAAAVRAEIERRAAGGCGTGWRYYERVTLDSPLFPGQSGTGCSPDNVGKVLSRLLGSGYTAHTLRHRFASSAYAAERDLRAVQELLGHSTPQTTARYVAVPDKAKTTAIAAVGVGSAA